MMLAIGAFVALIVTVAAVDQYLLDEHPATEVDGLIWRAKNAFDHIQDLQATLQVTNESLPAEIVRMKMRYVKGPPPVLSMRYVPSTDASEDLFALAARDETPTTDASEALFSLAVRDETFTVENDQLSHYIPSEDIVVSKRWTGAPLVDIGLGILDPSQLEADLGAGKITIRILQDITGFTGSPFATSLSIVGSFSQITTAPVVAFSAHITQSPQSYALCFSFCPEISVGEPQLSLGLAASLGAGTENPIPGSYILEVRDSETNNLLRMVWIDRDTYLVQRVLVFKHGQRTATFLVQSLTINQGLTSADVIAPPQAGVENIRG